MEVTALQRILLFAGREYYPSGGWQDFIGSFASRSEAEALLERTAKVVRFTPVGHIRIGVDGPEFSPEASERVVADLDWAHLIDGDTGEVVAVWDPEVGWVDGWPEWWEAPAST